MTMTRIRGERISKKKKNVINRVNRWEKQAIQEREEEQNRQLCYSNNNQTKLFSQAINSTTIN